MIADLQGLANDLSDSPSSFYSVSDASPFNHLLTRYTDNTQTLSELSFLTKSVLARLFGLIESLRAPLSQDELVRKSTELENEILNVTLIQVRAELNDKQAESLVLRESVLKLHQSVALHQDLYEETKIIKENLNLRLELAKEELKCKCPCRCGARKSGPDSNEEDQANVKELKEELKKLASERDYFKQQFNNEIEKCQKLQLELEVSEERFVQSRAFRKLVQQARELQKWIDSLRERNDELQRLHDEDLEIRHREMQQLKAKEEDRRKQLIAQIEGLQAKLITAEKERDEAKFALDEVTRKEQSQAKYMLELKSVIEDMDQDKARLTQQITQLKKQNETLYDKSEEDLKKIMELQDALHAKNSELAKLELVNELNRTQFSEQDLGNKLLEITQENLELKKLLETKENSLKMMHFKIEKLQNEVKNEKATAEMVLNELDLTGKAYEESLRKNRTLTFQLNEQEQNYMRLMSEKVKDSSHKALEEREKIAYETKISAKEQLISELKQAIGEHERQHASDTELIKLLERKLKSLEDRLRQFQQSHEEAIRKHEEMMTARKEVSNALRNAEKNAILRVTEAEQYRMQLQIKQQDISTLESKLKQLSELENYSSTDDYLNEELSKYRVRDI